MRMPTASLEQLAAMVGEEFPPTSWLEIDQDMIDRFADLTRDRQFIHIDPDKAKETPFGQTIAHGFLTLSLLSTQHEAVVPIPDSTKFAMNYGFDKVRFIAPVRSGKRVRARFKIAEFSETQPGRWRMRTDVTVEIEGENKPALSAEWIGLCFV
jgi:acyl dehydratase